MLEFCRSVNVSLESDHLKNRILSMVNSTEEQMEVENEVSNKINDKNNLDPSPRVTHEYHDEASLLEGEGGTDLVEAFTLQLEEEVMELGGFKAGIQMNIQQCPDMYQLESTVNMYSTQLDGDPGDDELSMDSFTEEEDVPAASINQAIPEAAAASETKGDASEPEEKVSRKVNDKKASKFDAREVGISECMRVLIISPPR